MCCGRILPLIGVRVQFQSKCRQAPGRCCLSPRNRTVGLFDGPGRREAASFLCGRHYRKSEMTVPIAAITLAIAATTATHKIVLYRVVSSCFWAFKAASCRQKSRRVTATVNAGKPLVRFAAARRQTRGCGPQPVGWDLIASF